MLPEVDKKMNITPSMMVALRGRLGLKSDDASRDDSIREMTPSEIVRECTAWNLGDPYWARLIAGWMMATGCTAEDLFHH